MDGFVVGIILLVVFFPLLIAGLSGAPWVPVKRHVIERINKIANLKQGQQFIELGSGDGRVCHFVALKNPKSKVVGVEIAWPLYALSLFRCLVQNVKNLRLVYGNCFNCDVSKADVVYMYFLPISMERRLKDKLVSQMKKGSKIISYLFEFKNWSGSHSVFKDEKGLHPVHIYKV